MKKILCIVSFLLLLSGCNNNYHPTIPYKNVDFVIYPNDVMYYRLNTYGGYEYFTGGVNGIVVYRLDEWTFYAYDRACPYDWEEKESWLVMHPSGLMLIDSLCGSMFNILDGTVVSGPARWPLRQYHTRFDGQRLRIFS